MTDATVGYIEIPPKTRTRTITVTPTNHLLNFIMIVSSFLATRRKGIAALIYPWILVAGNYLGGIPISHLWYEVVILEAGALGVYNIPNDVLVVEK